MLLVGTNLEQAQLMSNKYKDKFNFIIFDTNNSSSDNYIVHFLESVKSSMLQHEVTYIQYEHMIITILNKLNILYSVICDQVSDLADLKPNVTTYTIENNSYEQTLYKVFPWIEYKEETGKNKQDLEIIPTNKNALTFEDLLDDNVNITEADERSLKLTQNKLKVGMLLQAKNSLKRVLKLTNVLDKLYDELVDRIDVDITTTDTASIMYTADYISKALQDTNKLIMDLINNEKIQNFFIIDNSQNINVNADSNELDANSREKIRTAAKIIMNNLDLFQEGKLDQLVNPNIVEVVDKDVETKNEEDIVEQGDINDSPTKPVSN